MGASVVLSSSVVVSFSAVTFSAGAFSAGAFSDCASLSDPEDSAIDSKHFN